MSGAQRPMREQVIDFDFTTDDGTPMQLRVTRYRVKAHCSMRALRALVFSEHIHVKQQYELSKRELEYQLQREQILAKCPVATPSCHSEEWYASKIPLCVDLNGACGKIEAWLGWLLDERSRVRLYGYGKAQHTTNQQWSEVRKSLAEKNAELKRKLHVPAELRDVIAFEIGLKLSVLNASRFRERLRETVRTGAWVVCARHEYCMVCDCADGFLVWSALPKQPAVHLLY